MASGTDEGLRPPRTLTAELRFEQRSSNSRLVLLSIPKVFQPPQSQPPQHNPDSSSSDSVH